MRKVTSLLAAICLSLLVVPASAQVLFSTGFEDYTVGDINGQQGWTCDTTSEMSVSNTASTVISGSQSFLCFSNHGRSATHAIENAGDQTVIEVTMAKAHVNTGQWWCALQDTGAADRSAMFGFYNGKIAYGQGGSWAYYSTFNASTAYRFRAEVNVAANTWSLWVNDDLVGQDMATYGATPLAPTKVYFYRGYLSLTGVPTYANYCLADDLTISSVPEPSSLLALVCGLGGVVATIRRKK